MGLQTSLPDRTAFRPFKFRSVRQGYRPGRGRRTGTVSLPASVRVTPTGGPFQSLSFPDALVSTSKP